MKIKDIFREIADFAVDLIKILVVSAVIVIPIRYFLFQPFFVKGASMEPNFENGEYLIIDEISYRFSEPQRGDVVIFKYPLDTTQYYIKRIIGLPGETVRVSGGDVFITKKNGDKEERLLLEIYLLSQKVTFTQGNEEIEYHLGDEDYFVMGDNRRQSSDSRVWGSVKSDYLVGKVLLRAFPFSRLGLFFSFPRAELVPALQ